MSTRPKPSSEVSDEVIKSNPSRDDKEETSNTESEVSNTDNETPDTVTSKISSKINISSDDLKRYNKTMAPVSKTTLLAPIDLIMSFLTILSEGIDIPILFKASFLTCIIEVVLSLLFGRAIVGLYYCIGACILCVFIYLTNVTPHYKKTIESVKLYFDAGIMLDFVYRVTENMYAMKELFTHKKLPEDEEQLLEKNVSEKEET